MDMAAGSSWPWGHAAGAHLFISAQQEQSQKWSLTLKLLPALSDLLPPVSPEDSIRPQTHHQMGTLNDLLPPVSPHLLKIPYAPKQHHQMGTKSPKAWVRSHWSNTILLEASEGQSRWAGLFCFGHFMFFSGLLLVCLVNPADSVSQMVCLARSSILHPGPKTGEDKETSGDVRRERSP